MSHVKLAPFVLLFALLAGCACGGVNAPPADVPESVEGANLTMGASEVNGLKMKGVSCKTDGGLMTPLTMQAGLAKQKDALQKCVPEGAAVRVAFEFDGGPATGINVADAPSPKAATCVADALAAAKLIGQGKCVMTLHLTP